MELNCPLDRHYLRLGVVAWLFINAASLTKTSKLTCSQALSEGPSSNFLRAKMLSGLTAEDGEKMQK